MGGGLNRQNCPKPTSRSIFSNFLLLFYYDVDELMSKIQFWRKFQSLGIDCIVTGICSVSGVQFYVQKSDTELIFNFIIRIQKLHSFLVSKRKENKQESRNDH